MRIAYVSYYDARDVKNWSGTGYHIAKSLEAQGIDLEYVGPLKHQYAPVNIAEHLYHTRLRKRNDHAHRDPGFLRYYARQVEKRLQFLNVDLVFGPGILPLAYLNTKLPIAVWTDCTFANLLNYYGKFTDLSERTIRNGHAADGACFDRCTSAIFSCQWAAESAIRDYGMDPDKVRVVEFGANVPETRTETDIDRMILARGHPPASPCRLLFIGVDWQRKGGQIAVDAAKALHERGVPVELDLVGSAPSDPAALPPYVRSHGFISKSTPEGVAKIEGLLSKAHFFILPTRADCTPISFCEANSYGLPVLSTRTGGIPTTIRDGVNGRLFDLADTGAAYASYLQGVISRPGEYASMSRMAFGEYRSRLNWRVAGGRVREILECLIKPTNRRVAI